MQSFSGSPELLSDPKDETFARSILHTDDQHAYFHISGENENAHPSRPVDLATLKTR